MCEILVSSWPEFPNMLRQFITTSNFRKTASQKNLFSLLSVMGSGINVYVRKIAWCTTKTISFSNQKTEQIYFGNLLFTPENQTSSIFAWNSFKAKAIQTKLRVPFFLFSQILLKWLRIPHKTQIQISKLISKTELFIIIIIIIIIVIVNSEHYYHWIIIFLSFMLLV